MSLGVGKGGPLLRPNIKFQIRLTCPQIVQLITYSLEKLPKSHSRELIFGNYFFLLLMAACLTK